MSLYRDQGVVLRTIKLGEADRIVTIFGQAHGKIRGVAKGVRKTASRFGARLEPTTHLAFQAYRGRELDVITQVETLDAHRALREHYGCLTHAVSMLEAVDQVAQEREPNYGLYRMLVGALHTLAERPSPVISTAFFWKLLALEGFQPLVDDCARCSTETGPFVGFDLADGGVLCEPCTRNGGRPVDPATIAALRDVLNGRVHRILAEPPPATVLTELERLAIHALEYHSERRLRSAALL